MCFTLRWVFFCWVPVVVVIFVGFCWVGVLCQGDGAVYIVTLKQAPAAVHYYDSGDMRRLERDNDGKERLTTPNKPRYLPIQFFFSLIFV